MSMSESHPITIESVFRSQEEITQEILDGVDLRIKVLDLCKTIIWASATYGFTMGIRHSFFQAFSSTAKVPFPFFATLAVCLPSLHFVGLLLGSRIRFM